MLNKIKRWKLPQAKLNNEERIIAILQQPVPKHIAIIMDGNGRWAKKRALPRIAGHHEGMKTVEKITMLANQLQVNTLTLYAFSTENWKRPKQEIDYLMGLPEEFLGSFLPKLIKENVKVSMMGNKSQLPKNTLKAVENAIKQTAQNSGLTLNFALNYGSRAEIIHAIKCLADDVQKGSICVEDINDQTFSHYLMTKEISDPDLLIRTSGEIRLSNFMLWQVAYSELWFTDVLWPDFSEEHLLEAIEAYQRRSRRFGGLMEEEHES